MSKDDEPKPHSTVPPAPYGEKPLRTFALAVALPALLHYVLGAALVIGALAYMAQEIDKLEDARGITAMHAALNSFVNDLGGNVSDEGTWNEAYLNVVVNANPAWMDTTWGTTARAGDSYDTVFVTDSAGAIVFGENNDGALQGTISTYFPAASAMLVALDKAIGVSGDAATVTNFASDSKGLAGLAAISIHQSTPGTMTVPRDTRRVLWIAKHMTTATLQDFSTHYQLPLAALVDTPGADSSSIQVTDAAGKVAGTVAWSPDRPGGAAFDRAVLVATVIFFAIGLVLVVFLNLLRRMMMRRVAAIDAAAAAAAPSTVTSFVPHLDPEPFQRRAGEANAEPLLPELQDVKPTDFTIQYQPVFDVRAEALVGVEALLRWEIAAGKSLLEESLDTPAKTVLFDRAGLLAIRFATDELAPLIGTTLTIGVTVKQLTNPDFAEKVLGTLGATGFPARRLALALALDGNALQTLDPIRESLGVLRQAGVQVLLDRFVLTPSSLAMLQTQLVDGVRLAKDLTHDLDEAAGRSRLAAAAIETLRADKLAIVAPGVDRREDLARLVRLGCTQFQGSLFAAPMGLKTLTQLLLAPPVKRAS